MGCRDAARGGWGAWFAVTHQAPCRKCVPSSVVERRSPKPGQPRFEPSGMRIPRSRLQAGNDDKVPMRGVGHTASYQPLQGTLALSTSAQSPRLSGAGIRHDRTIGGTGQFRGGAAKRDPGELFRNADSRPTLAQKSHLDDGVDMRTMLTIAGIATGVALTVTVQRHAPHVLWWLFSRGDT